MSAGAFLKGDRRGTGARRLGLRSFHGVAILVVLIMLGSIAAVPSAIAQDDDTTEQTPDAGTDADASATPEASDDEGDNTASDEVPPVADEDTAGTAVEPGHPSVISQGLAFLTGDPVVWQVREIQLSEAQAESGNAAHLLQLDGETIVRNDVTAKRALLERGEGYYRAGEDAYTITPEGGDSTIWLFEVVDPDTVADDAFYESPLIDQYDEGTYDAELVRFDVEPGESFDLPQHTGPALLLVTGGEVDVQDERGLGLLAFEQGQLIDGEGTVTNSDTEPASFVFAMFGATVDDGSGAAEDATAVADDNAAAEAEDDTLAEEAAEPVAEEEAAAEEEAPAEEPAAGDSGVGATINVTAQIDLNLTIVADGVTVFDGPLPAGSSSGAVAGSTFEVTTSSGVNTIFTNGCGATFVMGYEEGEATYQLTAEPC